jgi:hypothetical protein
VQLFIFDGKGGKDWQPFELVSHRYGSGARAAVVEHLVHVLRELVEDMNDRYERLRELPNDLCPEGSSPRPLHVASGWGCRCGWCASTRSSATWNTPSTARSS